MKVDVPMNQLQLVVCTQGTHRITPSAYRSPTVSASPPETKKRKQIAGESSSPRKSLKITIKKKNEDEEHVNSGTITTSELKISDDFLKILQDNTFNSMDRGDVIDRIAKEAKDVYEVINKEYSPIPIPAHYDINNSDELCRTKEFTVIRHSIGNDEEFVTVGPTNINTVKRTPGSMSCIYHELLNKKDRGWEVMRTK
ncbi:hypothetical protein Tco_1503549 [Tanacetum coccineum]